MTEHNADNLRTQLLKKIQNLEPGDFPDYDEICDMVDNIEEAEQHNIYSDSVGWLESLELEGRQIAVIDAMHSDTPMIRTTDLYRIENTP